METKTVTRERNLSSAKPTSIFKKILVAVDGSDSAKRAARDAVGLAEKLGAELIVLHAITPPATYYGSRYPTLSGMSPHQFHRRRSTHTTNTRERLPRV